MHIQLQYDKQQISIQVPDKTTVLKTRYPSPKRTASELVKQALQHPIQSTDLATIVKHRKPGDVVVVVSDVTRPIPYSHFLHELFSLLLDSGVQQQEILILIATGMHRPSNAAERIEILGKEIASTYRILDHDPEADDLVKLGEKSRAGNDIYLNCQFLQAGLKITTGLVEPHYMAGFSGGRKAVCPGLASLDTVQNFHGYDFLDDANATIASLQQNPCHLESLSIARAAGVDFSLNVVINHSRHVVAAFAGDIEHAHVQACEFVKHCANPVVEKEFDVVLTCSAGYPLDATYYQSTKSFVCCLPAIKPGGTLITTGGCAEGIGSDEYTGLLMKYADDHKLFLKDIASNSEVVKDQWQHQMHCRALDKVGKENIHFVTGNLEQGTLSKLSVTPHSTKNVQEKIQQLVDEQVKAGKRICVIPEGPYCSPISEKA